MRSSAFLRGLAAVCIAATASAASGQTAIQLFGPVNVRNSTQGTGYGDKANIFNSTILNLNCTEPIQATISSSPDGTANVLVDNYISLSVGGATPVDICKNGTSENGGQQNCFTDAYESKASGGGLNNQDPDGLVSTGGVAPLDISGYLSSGQIQAQIATVDTGGYFTSSTLYLVTNCTSAGVSGPGQITGNPISQSNPTGPQLTQNYSFNSSNNQQVQFTYDLSVAQNAGTLAITDGSTPSTGDTPLNPATFQSTYLNGTSFATANCLTHAGELYNGSPACKLYTLTCQVGTNPNQSGASVPGIPTTQRGFPGGFRRPHLYPARYYRHGWLDLPSGRGLPGGERRLERRLLRLRSRIQHYESALPAERAHQFFGSGRLQERRIGASSQLNIYYRSPGARGSNRRQRDRAATRVLDQ